MSYRGLHLQQRYDSKTGPPKIAAVAAVMELLWRAMALRERLKLHLNPRCASFCPLAESTTC